jgi:NADH dehydrogenase
VIASTNNLQARNQRLEIGGPKPYSLKDAVAAFQRELNHKIQVITVNPGQPVPGLPDSMTTMLAGLEFFDSPVDMTELSIKFDVKLTSLEEFARRFVEQAKRKKT